MISTRWSLTDMGVYYNSGAEFSLPSPDWRWLILAVAVTALITYATLVVTS